VSVGEKIFDFCFLLVSFAVEAFKFERPEGEAVIAGAGGTFAVTPSFVGKNHFRCGGLKMVFFSQPTLQMLMFILCQ